MRVISGIARGKRLKTLEGLDVRPTTDRVKESVFNIIQFDLPAARVLDLFCGCGQLGIEALSRNADFCVFVDSSVKSQQCTKDNLMSAGLFAKSRVVSMDAFQFAANTKEKFDIIFLDPPYKQGILQRILPLTSEILNPGGIVICEHPTDDPMPDSTDKLKMLKQYRYGKIYISTYKHTQDVE